jgi:hypothetical protein
MDGYYQSNRKEIYPIKLEISHGDRKFVTGLRAIQELSKEDIHNLLVNLEKEWTPEKANNLAYLVSYKNSYIKWAVTYYYNHWALNRSKYMDAKMAHFLSRIVFLDMSRSNSSEKKNSFEGKEGHFSYIPYSKEGFVSKIRAINRTFPGNKSFIDVGCGIGEKLLFAHVFGKFDSVTGIEYNKHTFELFAYFFSKHFYLDSTIKSYTANRNRTIKIIENDKKLESLVKKTVVCKIIKGDAKKLNYSKYDTIYLYKPISDSESMWEVYRRIVKTAPIGAVITDVGGFGGFITELKLSKYGADLIQKTKDGFVPYYYDKEHYTEIKDKK